MSDRHLVFARDALLDSPSALPHLLAGSRQALGLRDREALVQVSLLHPDGGHAIGHACLTGCLATLYMPHILIRAVRLPLPVTFHPLSLRRLPLERFFPLSPLSPAL